jgi:hypothetical protein
MATLPATSSRSLASQKEAEVSRMRRVKLKIGPPVGGKKGQGKRTQTRQSDDGNGRVRGQGREGKQGIRRVSLS